jgi:2-phospho-L-lactate guanylyltransferase
MDSVSRPDWHVVIPVKGGPDAKTRLAVGRDDIRSAIARAIAEDSVAAALASMPPGRVVVTTADLAVAGWAAAAGAIVVEDPALGLNAAVESGVDRVAETGGTGEVPVAVLLGDVPALRPIDLQEALDACARHDRAVVPDIAGAGTVLLTSLDARRLEPHFGSGSAAEHERLGHVRLDLDLPHLRTDVDDAASLARALDLGLGPRTSVVVGERNPEHAEG